MKFFGEGEKKVQRGSESIYIFHFDLNCYYHIISELENIRDKETNRRRRKAIQNWHMACLLHFNPQFRVLRKDYLEGIREKRTITKKSEKKEKTMEDSKGSIVTIEINQKPPAYTKYSA